MYHLAMLYLAGNGSTVVEHSPHRLQGLGFKSGLCSCRLERERDDGNFVLS
jgi:hypothetical protein